MDRLADRARFEIQNDRDIDLFISIFIHLWDDMISRGGGIELLQTLMSATEGAIPETGSESGESQIQKWIVDNQPEGKTAEVLRKLLKSILERTTKQGPIYIFFAEYYNDKFYSDIHSFHYAAKYFPVPNVCSRFFLFDAQRLHELHQKKKKDISSAFIGSIVRRPLPGREIGRTLINPTYLFPTNDNGELKCNIWRNKYRLTMFGIPLTVWAFPYTMQDGEVATCAETTVLNITDYYSQRYAEYRMTFPSTISEIVQRNSIVKSVPSSGLSYEMVSKVFVELGFSPVMYHTDRIKYRFGELLHTYVASGFPVALGLEANDGESKGHSVIVIGTQNRLIDADSQKREKAYRELPVLRLPDKKTERTNYQALKGAFDNMYIVMDDGRAPYACAEISDRDGEVYLRYADDNAEWKISIFLVPMGGEMLMDADSAINSFRYVLKSKEFGYTAYIQKLLAQNDDIPGLSDYLSGESKDNPLLTRIFLCPSKRLKEQRIREYREDSDWESMNLFQEVHLPRYVWCCELFTRSSYSDEVAQCVGEILIDANSVAAPDDYFQNIVWIKYPWKIACRPPNRDIKKLDDEMRESVDAHAKTWTPITPYRFELH